jgi:hypothetical protein
MTSPTAKRQVSSQETAAADLISDETGKPLRRLRFSENRQLKGGVSVLYIRVTVERQYHYNRSTAESNVWHTAFFPAERAGLKIKKSRRVYQRDGVIE